MFIPGWATDCRIFDSITLPYNYLLPGEFSPTTFVQDLADTLRENRISRVSLFGYSLGGFLACDFARKYADCIDRLMLVGIRRCYDQPALAVIKNRVRKNKEAFLYKFYEQCCSSRGQWLYFKNNYYTDYCRKFDHAYLNEGLDYLAAAAIDPQPLRSLKKITIMHGECDQVAPLQEAIDLKAALPQAQLKVVPVQGHLFFLPPGVLGDILV
ncbi:MAG: alpha/beta hydrolase [Saprospiraceae bacterium]|nr:alpha/beta hydrolase [Saprospiraceae bacterium]